MGDKLNFAVGLMIKQSFEKRLKKEEILWITKKD